jgi:hypothetical protein
MYNIDQSIDRSLVLKVKITIGYFSVFQMVTFLHHFNDKGSNVEQLVFPTTVRY